MRTWLCLGELAGTGMGLGGGLYKSMKEEAIVGFVQLQLKKKGRARGTAVESFIYFLTLFLLLTLL